MRQIEVDKALPGVEIGFLDRHIEIAATHIVDQDIDGAGFREDALAQGLAYFRLGYIGGKGPDLAPAVADLGGGFRKCVRITSV